MTDTRKNLTFSVRAYMAEIGAKGGKTKGKSKARSREQMQAAAQKRWAQKKRGG